MLLGNTICLHSSDKASLRGRRQEQRTDCALLCFGGQPVSSLNTPFQLSARGKELPVSPQCNRGRWKGYTDEPGFSVVFKYWSPAQLSFEVQLAGEVPDRAVAEVLPVVAVTSTGNNRSLNGVLWEKAHVPLLGWWAATSECGICLCVRFTCKELAVKNAGFIGISESEKKKKQTAWMLLTDLLTKHKR